MTKNDSKRYFFLDSGDGYRLENFGGYVFKRPCATAYWHPQNKTKWNKFDAHFSRDDDEGGWTFKNKIPKNGWHVEVENIIFKVQTTDFGHMGVFPEHSSLWRFVSEKIRSSKRKEPIKVLNLFAYTGGVTLAAAQAGASVTHLDASKPMVALARENAQINQLGKAPIRWITDDVFKFLNRELKRESFYDIIVLDPPSFGRGTNHEVFKIEKDILPLLNLCKKLMTKTPLALVFSCHTPSFTPTVMHHLIKQAMKDSSSGHIESGEMLLTKNHDSKDFPLPLGSYALWTT